MFQAIEIGPFLLWTRLVFLLVGIALSVEFFLRIAETANLPLQHFRQYWYWYITSFVLGGRFFAVLAELTVYMRDPLRTFAFGDGAFSFLGGALALSIVIFFVTRDHRSIFLQWLDALLPAVTFGLVFDWLGAFFAGVAYGSPTDFFIHITYDAPDVRYTIPIHPVQLYYALFYFVLTFVLLVIRKRAKRVGAETLAGIAMAAVATFFLESLRGDFSIPVFASLPDVLLLIGLFLSLGLMLLAAHRLHVKGVLIYFCCLGGALIFYLWGLRPSLDFEGYPLRISQLLSLISFLATAVYVLIIRRRHPYF